MENNTVHIDISEYRELLTDSNNLSIILDFMFDNATLNYDDKTLCFDDYRISALLSTMFNYKYDTTVNILKRLKEEKR